MTEMEITYLRETIDYVSYDENRFTINYGEEKVVMGATFIDDPVASIFFSSAAIYKTILDLDEKVKISLHSSINFVENTDFNNWNPIYAPSEEENMAIYFAENAIYRTAVLWDLLAQLFNIIYSLGIPFDKVYATMLFHNAQQGKKANSFAQKVYEYMEQEDNLDFEPWKGNYAFVKEFRNKMTHRDSPNITSISDFSIELRTPVVFLLKRVIEDYKQVSNFISEFIDNYFSDLEAYNV